MRMRVLIADDEPLARESLRALLSREEEARVVGECAAGDEVVEEIRRTTPDLVFLDVDMPELDGFQVVQEIGPERMPHVIFVTAHGEHALRAFDLRALDYLVKPFGLERFRQAFARARSLIAGPAPDEERDAEVRSLLERLRREQRQIERLLAGTEERFLERLMVKVGGKVLFLRAEEIDWIEAEGNYARLHVGKQAYLVRETMSALEGRLDPRRFLRVHRSTIVNLDQVRELRPWFAGDYLVILRDGTELRLSRGYRARIEEKLL